MIETALQPREVVERLRAQTSPRGLGMFRVRGKRRFWGSVADNDFQLTRVRGYRTSFAAVLEGVVEPERAGSRVVVTMRLNRLAALFMILWFGGLGIFQLLGLVLLIAGAQGDKWVVAVPVPFGATAYAFIWLVFTYEARRSQRALEETVGRGP